MRPCGGPSYSPRPAPSPCREQIASHIRDHDLGRSAAPAGHAAIPRVTSHKIISGAQAAMNCARGGCPAPLHRCEISDALHPVQPAWRPRKVLCGLLSRGGRVCLGRPCLRVSVIEAERIGQRREDSCLLSSFLEIGSEPRSRERARARRRACGRPHPGASADGGERLRAR